MPGRVSALVLATQVSVSVAIGANARTQPAAAAATWPAAEAPPAARPPARFRSKAPSATPERVPPLYVKTLSETGLPGTETLDWLDFGLEQRTRWEHRDDDYFRDVLQEDNALLLRSRGYVGVNKVLDPFRFAIEFQDSRQFNSNFPPTNQDANEADVLQAFGELYFADALGRGQPFRLQTGRLTFDYVDRKLVSRNRWRNTTNAFDGFRLKLGESSSDWQFDVFAAQPVERRLTRPDRPDEERWLYGLVGAWRRWDRAVTLEPYYFILDEDRKDDETADREIHTLGLHAFGPIGQSGFDYDVDAAFQFGEDGERDQRALATFGELGYTFDHAWQPRISAQAAWASGDRAGDDNLNERFDRLFGSSHAWSMFNYITWQNLILTRLRLEARPLNRLRFDTSYAAYWLASDADAWVIGRRRDPAGRSGDFLGQEINARVRYQLNPRVEIDMGYAYFFAGPFVGHTGEADDSDLFYVQTTMRLFK